MHAPLRDEVKWEFRYFFLHTKLSKNGERQRGCVAQEIRVHVHLSLLPLRRLTGIKYS